MHQVGVSFDLYYDAWKHKIKIPLFIVLNMEGPILGLEVEERYRIR